GQPAGGGLHRRGGRQRELGSGPAERDQTHLVPALVGVEQQGQDRALDRAHPLPGRHRPAGVHGEEHQVSLTALAYRLAQVGRGRPEEGGGAAGGGGGPDGGGTARSPEGGGADGGGEVQGEGPVLRKAGANSTAERAAGRGPTAWRALAYPRDGEQPGPERGRGRNRSARRGVGGLLGLMGLMGDRKSTR